MPQTIDELKRAWSGLCARLGVKEIATVDDALAALDAALEGLASKDAMLNEAIASGRIAKYQRGTYLHACNGHAGVLRLLLKERPAGVFNGSGAAMPTAGAADKVCRQLGITREEYGQAGRRS